MNSTATISLNGRLELIKLEKGIRQGDALSPKIFTAVLKLILGHWLDSYRDQNRRNETGPFEISWWHCYFFRKHKTNANYARWTIWGKQEPIRKRKGFKEIWQTIGETIILVRLILFFSSNKSVFVLDTLFLKIIGKHW